MKKRLTIAIAIITIIYSCNQSNNNSVNQFPTVIDLDTAISDFTIRNIEIAAESGLTFKDTGIISYSIDAIGFKEVSHQSTILSYSQNAPIYFKDQLLTSKITRVHRNGKLKFEAECINGWIEGTTKTYDSLGQITHIFNYQGGKLNGICEEYFPNNKLARSIPMSRGKVNGTVKWYYENENLAFEGKMLDGEKSGEHIYYYSSGKKSAILKYSYGIRRHSFWRDSTEMGYRAHGEFLEFFENGDIKYKATYVNGIPEGRVAAYYSKDKLMYMENWENGKIVGETKHYYENGQLQCVGKFNKRGEETGIWREYCSNGTIRLTINFNNGKIIEQHYFNCGDENSSSDEVGDLRSIFPGIESRY
jgi:antitoxin component YwqK of YwqJK toxin-antitoxin module